jgi:putative flippase GtrA
MTSRSGGRGNAFVLVGILGFALQIGMMALLTAAGWPYAPAAVVAVELAVMHNFFWHERWTWRDRALASGAPGRLVRFHVSNGLTSIVGSVVFTALLVEWAGAPVLLANAAAVALTAAANYLVADRWVFARTAAALVPAFLILGAPAAQAAELRPETIAAWQSHIAAVEARGRDRITVGEPVGESVGVPGGTIHRWRAATLVRGVTVDHLVHVLMHPGTPPPQEDVLESRVLDRSGSTLRVYIKLVRSAVVTVTYDTEHTMTFRRESSHLTTSRSVATRIAEVDGGDRGFLWRLNSYWAYRQVPEGVVVELESVSLSRSVPGVLKPIAGPIIGRIARESMVRTLTALREHVQASGSGLPAAGAAGVGLYLKPGARSPEPDLGVFEA